MSFEGDTVDSLIDSLETQLENLASESDYEAGIEIDELLEQRPTDEADKAEYVTQLREALDFYRPEERVGMDGRPLNSDRGNR